LTEVGVEDADVGEGAWFSGGGAGREGKGRAAGVFGTPRVLLSGTASVGAAAVAAEVGGCCGGVQGEDEGEEGERGGELHFGGDL